VENIPVDDKTGKLFVNSRDTLKRCRAFFCENLNVRSSVDQNLIEQIQIRLISTTEEHIQIAQTSIQEVKKAVNQMKSRKAQGTDEVTVNILKAGGEPVIRWFLEFFTDVW